MPKTSIRWRKTRLNQCFENRIAAAIIRAFRNFRLGNCFMPTVRVKENEPFEVAMRRLKRTIEKTGLLTDLRARVLRKAHVRAQTQACRGGETSLQAYPLAHAPAQAVLNPVKGE